MESYYDIEKLKLENTAVALGQFDAIHICHKEIIENTVKCAKENNLKSLVYIFSNNPLDVIHGIENRSINTLEKRLQILEKMGVDIVVAQNFDKEFMKLSALDFIESYLIKRLGAKYVFAGFNYRFGKGAGADAKYLKDECENRGIKVFIAPKISLRGDCVSSTRIRSEIEGGNFKEVTALMGRPFSLKGVVVKGNQIGRDLGFPTANLNLPNQRLIIKNGVYITNTTVDEKKYLSMTNVGKRPTVEEGQAFIETYIDGFSHDIYGKVIEIEFLDFLRDIKKFQTINELKEQLKKDIKEMRNYFKGEKI